MDDAIRDDALFAGEFEPLAQGVHQQGEFWFVPVRLSRFDAPESRFPLYARLASLESYLQTERGLRVALLPVVEPLAA